MSLSSKNHVNLFCCLCYDAHSLSQLSHKVALFHTHRHYNLISQSNPHTLMLYLSYTQTSTLTFTDCLSLSITHSHPHTLTHHTQYTSSSVIWAVTLSGRPATASPLSSSSSLPFTQDIRPLENTPFFWFYFTQIIGFAHTQFENVSSI